MVYGPRAGPGTWLAVALTTLAILSLLTLAVGARPLAQLGTSSVTGPLALSAGVKPGPNLLIDQLEPLPLIPRDLPDAAASRAVSVYDHVRPHQPANLVDMFTASWSGLEQHSGGRIALAELGDHLVYGSDDPTQEVMAAALRTLDGAPRSADRLSNAAVALFQLGLAGPYQVNGRPVANTLALEGRSLDLLRVVAGQYPDARAATLNLAFLQSALTPACGPTDYDLLAAASTARAWASSHPADVTARALLASVEVRGSVSPAALDAALADLSPLLASTQTAALAHALRGDAFIESAARLRVQAASLARQNAGQALAEYNQALASAHDPGLLAGRAAALSALGRSAEAIEAQTQAVAMQPDSPELLLQLSEIQESAGRFSDMRDSARRAFTASLRDLNPPITGSRLFGQSLPGDRGWLGWSIGSERPPQLVPFIQGQCGGVAVEASDLVPAATGGDPAEAIRTVPPVDAAVLMSLQGSILLADVRGAELDTLAWYVTASGEPPSTGDLDYLDSVRNALGGVMLSAGQPLLAGASQDRALYFAQTGLRYAAAASQEQAPAAAAALFSHAADVCAQSANQAASGDLSVIPNRICEAESAFHAGDAARAARALHVASNDASQLKQTDKQPDLDYELAQVSMKLGDRDTARRLLTRAALTREFGHEALFASEGLEQLGNLALDEGRAERAIGYFDLALASIGDSASTAHWSSEQAQAARVAQRVHNNRGVALIRSQQKSPDEPPDCRRWRAICTSARDDLLAAVGFDPANPDYLLNLGWVERLLGNRSAAMTALAGAGDSGPFAFNALNDLGVLQAQAGNDGAAKHSFETALRQAPGYDLAAWNLGLLWLRKGPAGIPRGQAYLARAVAGNPRLASAPLDFRTDERIYRHVFGSLPSSSGTLPLGQTYTTAALQLLTVGSALGGLATTPVEAADAAPTGKLVDALRERGIDLLGRVQRRLRLPLTALRRVAGKRLRVAAGLGRPWLLTGLAIVVVTTWITLTTPGAARLTAVFAALFAAALAVLVHETAQAIAACLAGARLRPVYWVPGIVLALALMPLRLGSGPYVGHRAERGVSAARAWWIQLAGPLANLALAASALALYHWQPMPLLRSVVQAQLLVLGFTILPIRPLDGGVLSRRHAWVLGTLGLAVGLGSFALIVAQR